MSATPGKTARPRIAVLLGDAAGIGPEIAVKLLARPANRGAADVVAIGDRRAWDAGRRIAALDLEIEPLTEISGVASNRERIAFLEVPIEGELPALGRSSAAAGRAALRALSLAANAAVGGAVGGILFAPLNKRSLRQGGLEQEDEMRFLQAELGVRGFVTEFNITDDLWTSRVTSHVPLREVADALSVDGIVDAVRILGDNLRRAGKPSPRIAVAALNPHGGDGGNYGDEEIRVIGPAVERARAEGWQVTGPLPADTVFLAARRGDFDAVVSMYHDQGQIAMKLMGFDRGVTLLGGLPVPVTTCASGTAFDIAGKGIANVEGLQHAFDIVTRMAKA